LEGGNDPISVSRVAIPLFVTGATLHRRLLIAVAMQRHCQNLSQAELIEIRLFGRVERSNGPLFKLDNPAAFKTGFSRDGETGKMAKRT
jgi:hypothetical protein